MADETIRDSPEARDELPFAPAGYEIGELLGRGGMGEVLLARDPSIGRDVAIKRMRGAHDQIAVDRFIREAKIQARLDHPAIVPVHELGRDAENRPFFTMKRLSGTTLFDVLLEKPRRPLQQLLRAMVDAALAIEFAHQRGIVHRDIKPTNIQLGDYGEVYVLDWGLARVVVERDREGADLAYLPSPDSGMTKAGAILGTPGYMPPEQIHGARDVGPPADVYALGAILFEILTAQRLHPDGDAVARTVQMPTQSPRDRTPDREIPPELDGVCVAALQREPAERPSARVFADRIQAYLDGDRDTARRRSLAAEHLAVAHAAIASGDPDRRVVALRAANHALALDPESTQAATTAMALVLEPPKVLPVALQDHLRDGELDIMSTQVLAASLALGSPLAFWPVAIALGVKDWTPMVFGSIIILAMIAGTVWEAKVRRSYFWPWIICHGLLVAAFSRVLGPWVVVPAITNGLGLAILGTPTVGDRPFHVLAALVTGYTVPIILEVAGVLSSTWEMTADGKLVTWSAAFAWPGKGGAAFLIVANLALIIIVGLFAHALAGSRRDAFRRSEIQRWHLAQLLPS